MSENTEPQEENKDKVERKFATVISKLTAVVNGPQQLKPLKKLPELLKAYHEMLKAVAQKKKELEELEKKKKEEFIKAARALFDKIEDVGAVEESYKKGLGALVEESRNEKPNQYGSKKETKSRRS
jgi:aspartate ammonia-lyase